jgi:hypothetical protein
LQAGAEAGLLIDGLIHRDHFQYNLLVQLVVAVLAAVQVALDQVVQQEQVAQLVLLVLVVVVLAAEGVVEYFQEQVEPEVP